MNDFGVQSRQRVSSSWLYIQFVESLGIHEVHFLDIYLHLSIFCRILFVFLNSGSFLFAILTICYLFCFGILIGIMDQNRK